MNEDELVLLTGCRILDTNNSHQVDKVVIAKAVELFLRCGVAMVAVTRGKKGSYVACNIAERFEQTPALPTSWINCSAHIPATLLPKGTRLNTNGAGDSYISGLLIASMLRHTGNITSNFSKASALDEASQKKEENPTAVKSSRGSSRSGKKMTPYTLYMKENYVMLKQQCKDDKKAIFTRCHEMWESESTEVKSMYERMVKEEYNEVDSETSASICISDTSLEAMDISKSFSSYSDVKFHTEHEANSSLNFESAIQFAGLVAAHHVDTNTRDLDSLDIIGLLDRSIVSLSPMVPNEI